MRKPKITLALFLMASDVFAVDYAYKGVGNFKTLDTFPTVEAFENVHKAYTQDCLDNTYGGTGGIPCLIAYDLWDRELNIYYKKLYDRLDKNGKELLRNSQRAWLASRDQTQTLTSHLVERRYAGETGSLYLLMRASDLNDSSAAIVKQRVLWLKDRLDFVSMPPE